MSAFAAAGPDRPLRPALAIAGAVRRVRPRVVVATLAIALALEVLWLYDTAYADDVPLAASYLSLSIVNLLMAFAMMFTTFVADEYVEFGALPWRAYASAVLVGSALGAFGEWLVHHALALAATPIPGLRADATGNYAAFVFFEYLIWGSIAVWLYVGCRSEMRARARMNASRLQRAQTQRRALEAQLQALQAQVEPQFLLDTLASVRDRYARDGQAGSRLLGALIAYLRSVLPQLRAPSSSLAREVDLVRAYLGVVRESVAADVAFEANVDVAGDASMPPMILLPLVNRAARGRLSQGGFGVAIEASVSQRTLGVSIRCSGDAFACAGTDDAVATILDRLRALYGGEGRLTLGKADDAGIAKVEIPLESADSRRR